MIVKKCLECLMDFKSYPSRNRLHCSRRCGNKNKKGTFVNGHKWVGKLRVEKRQHSYGYVEIYAPEHPYRSVRNGVLEHRLVMEKYLGRYLNQKEVVHHINGVRNDNRIENLMLFSNNSEHIKYEYQTNEVFRSQMVKNQFKSKLV